MRAEHFLQHQTSKDLFAYWRSLKRRKATPGRDDVDPVAIRHILADAFALDLDPGFDFPFEMAGTRISALFLRDQRGRSFNDMWSEDDRRNAAAAVLTAVDGGTPIVINAQACVQGHAPLGIEMLLLPLSHPDKGGGSLIGALTPAYQPEWIGHRRAGQLELTSIRILAAPYAANLFKAPHFEPPAPMYEPPRLVVLQGGKR